ncbi:hypothetical protein HK099_006816 [Clydaea vesicula]|uniref:Pentatricopeptide repeat-containing protein n=1 Tax=Clydaea vesicula TaxID=447962 RepID=A0AAD5U9U3_9FUNG|nr:hypothetical protein HK099_006816 [Clydaea vesicula]
MFQNILRHKHNRTRSQCISNLAISRCVNKQFNYPCFHLVQKCFLTSQLPSLRTHSEGPVKEKKSNYKQKSEDLKMDKTILLKHNINKFMYSINTMNLNEAISNYNDLKKNSTTASIFSCVNQTNFSKYLELLEDSYLKNKIASVNALNQFAEDFRPILQRKYLDQQTKNNIATLIRLLGTVGNVESAVQFFITFKSTSLSRRELLDLQIFQIMLIIFERHKMIRNAEIMFKEMVENANLVLDKLTFVLMIKCYASVADVNGAFKIFRYLTTQTNYGVNYGVFHSLISASKSLKNPSPSHSPQAILDIMRKYNFPPNERTYTMIMAIFVQRRQFVEAVNLFKKMKEDALTNPEATPQIATYNTVLNIYGTIGDIQHAKVIYKEICEKLKPNNVTFTILLKAFKKVNAFNAAKQLILEMIKKKIAVPSRDFNLVLSFKTNPVEYEKLYREFIQLGMIPDIYTVKILICSYVDKSDFEGVVKIYKESRQVYKITPDSAFFEEVLNRILRLTRKQYIISRVDTNTTTKNDLESVFKVLMYFEEEIMKISNFNLQLVFNLASIKNCLILTKLYLDQLNFVKKEDVLLHFLVNFKEMFLGEGIEGTDNHKVIIPNEATLKIILNELPKSEVGSKCSIIEKEILLLCYTMLGKHSVFLEPDLHTSVADRIMKLSEVKVSYCGGGA